MPLDITCPKCNEISTLPYDDINKIEDTFYATMDCRNEKCHALLYSHEEKGIILFHEYMHEETDGIWDKEGKNTGYIDIE